MAKKILNIIESAYRATLEEQDDTVLWFTHVMKGAGSDVDILLRGNAVNYAVVGQDASGLRFGERHQTQPPQIEKDVAKLTAKGVKVFIVQDDLAERGLTKNELIPSVESINGADLPKLFSGYERVFHW